MMTLITFTIVTTNYPTKMATFFNSGIAQAIAHTIVATQFQKKQQ